MLREGLGASSTAQSVNGQWPFAHHSPLTIEIKETKIRLAARRTLDKKHACEETHHPDTSMNREPCIAYALHDDMSRTRAHLRFVELNENSKVLHRHHSSLDLEALL